MAVAGEVGESEERRPRTGLTPLRFVGPDLAVKWITPDAASRHPGFFARVLARALLGSAAHEKAPSAAWRIGLIIKCPGLDFPHRPSHDPSHVRDRLLVQWLSIRKAEGPAFAGPSGHLRCPGLDFPHHPSHDPTHVRDRLLIQLLSKRKAKGPALRSLLVTTCPGLDSNQHSLSATRPSSVRVYQFHHLGRRQRSLDFRRGFLSSCDPAGARTQDPDIKSVVLYQLSYRIVQHIDHLLGNPLRLGTANVEIASNATSDLHLSFFSMMGWRSNGTLRSKRCRNVASVR